MVWTRDYTPTGKGVRRFLEMFVHSETAFVKDILLEISKSTFYRTVLPQLDKLNGKISSRAPGHFFIRADFKHNAVTGGYALLMQRDPSVHLQERNGDFEITVEDAG